MSARGEIARLAEIAAPTVGIVTNIGRPIWKAARPRRGRPGQGRTLRRPAARRHRGDQCRRRAGGAAAGGQRRAAAAFRLCGRGRGAGRRGRRMRPVVAFPAAVCRGGSWPGPTGGGRAATTCQRPGRRGRGSCPGDAQGTVIARGLEAFRPAAGAHGGLFPWREVLLLEDSYNANPLSMQAALATLDRAGRQCRRIAVLGDMLELGDQAAATAPEVGPTGSRRARLPDAVWARWPSEVAAGALAAAACRPQRVRSSPHHEEAPAVLHELLQPGDRVLVKGSRGMRMEKICATLCGVEPARRAAGNC